MSNNNVQQTGMLWKTQTPGYFTLAAAKDMNMGTDGFFKEAGNQEIFFAEDSAANGTCAAAVAFQAVAAAGNMHQAVVASQRRKCS